MASLLQKLVKTSCSPPPTPLRILPYLGKPLASGAEPSPSHIQTDPLLAVNPGADADAEWWPPSLLSTHQVYPSFPHCFAVDLISIAPRVGSGAEELEEGGDDASGETAVVWADSVKKKRKRKMNKHKLRKLRRRLRRQT